MPPNDVVSLRRDEKSKRRGRQHAEEPTSQNKAPRMGAHRRTTEMLKREEFIIGLLV